MFSSKQTSGELTEKLLHQVGDLFELMQNSGAKRLKGSQQTSLHLQNRNRADSTSPLDRILDQLNEVTTLTFLCFLMVILLLLKAV